MDTILGDGKFVPLHGELAALGVWLNTSSHNEHVPEVERYICTLKERVRACYNTLPFQKYLHWLIIKMAYTRNFWLNAFPHMDEISQTMTPREIVMGFKVNFLQHCKLEVGDYVQTHEEHTNDMKSHMIDALSLWPTGNSQGGYYFYSLTMGRVITQQRYTIFAMPHEEIEHIHHKAQQENASTGLSILNCWREDILDDPVYSNDSFDPAEDDDTPDDDSSYCPEEEEGSSSLPHELDSESVAPVEALSVEPDPTKDIKTEGVEHHPQPDTIEPDDETVITQPKVTHVEESDLFVPV